MCHMAGDWGSARSSSRGVRPVLARRNILVCSEAWVEITLSVPDYRARMYVPIACTLTSRFRAIM